MICPKVLRSTLLNETGILPDSDAIENEIDNVENELDEMIDEIKD